VESLEGAWEEIEISPIRDAAFERAPVAEPWWVKRIWTKWERLSEMVYKAGSMGLATLEKEPLRASVCMASGRFGLAEGPRKTLIPVPHVEGG
jgi:hypothetical protein